MSENISINLNLNNFVSEKKVTRAEYTAMVVKALNMGPSTYNNAYNDIAAGHPYAGEVQTALDKGIIAEGFADGVFFRPDEFITREEIAVLNIKAFQYKAGKNIQYGNLDRYQDREDVSLWALPYVKTANAIGLIHGVDRTRFSPKDYISCTEAKSFIKKLSDKCENIEQELLVDIPDIKPLLDVKMRDTSICLGGDGMYYMTGSTGQDIWDHNDGIELWRSPDLKQWEYIGLVWSIERDGTWHKQWNIHRGRPIRSIWAPEVHYIKGNYWLAYSMPLMGTGLLKSATGKPEGPYINALSEDKPLTPAIDASLFEDDDGKVYFVYNNGCIALMKDDMSGLAEEPRQMLAIPPDLNPSHHSAHKSGRFDDIGHEGAFLFKANGRYYMSCADGYSTAGRYSSMVAISDSIYGPYTMRHEAVPCGGHNTFFKDKQGQWWSTFFGNDNSAPFREKPAILQIDFNEDGTVRVK